MTLRLAPDGSEARITMPPWGRISDAEHFARERSEWLAQQLGRMPMQQAPVAGSSILYRGRPLTIVWHPGASRAPSADTTRIVLGGPEQSVSSRLRRWLECQALRLCGEDLEEFAKRAAVPRPPLRLSRAARRWGSCAADGTIRINWRLVMAPDAVRRSVVAHEVAHLTHFDHSPAFHGHAARLFEGDLIEANRWLKHEGRKLYVPFG